MAAGKPVDIAEKLRARWNRFAREENCYLECGIAFGGRKGG
jgi:hypothetical protein